MSTHVMPDCGGCGREVPDGAHIAYHTTWTDCPPGCRCPVMYCPDCCPCATNPAALRAQRVPA